MFWKKKWLRRKTQPSDYLPPIRRTEFGISDNLKRSLCEPAGLNMKKVGSWWRSLFIHDLSMDSHTNGSQAHKLTFSSENKNSFRLQSTRYPTPDNITETKIWQIIFQAGTEEVFCNSLFSTQKQMLCSTPNRSEHDVNICCILLARTSLRFIS